MSYLINVKAMKTKDLIEVYQVSDSKETKRTVLTELYGLWNKTISNFVWSFVGRNRFNLDCIEASSGLKF